MMECFFKDSVPTKGGPSQINAMQCNTTLMKLSLYYLSQTFWFSSCFTFNQFYLHSNFILYISLILEPFPAFPPEMTGEFSCHVPTLMIVVFLCRCLCFLLVAQHSLQQLICSVKDHLLVEFCVFVVMEYVHVYSRLNPIRCQ